MIYGEQKFPLTRGSSDAIFNNRLAEMESPNGRRHVVTHKTWITVPTSKLLNNCHSQDSEGEKLFIVAIV